MNSFDHLLFLIFFFFFTHECLLFRSNVLISCFTLPAQGDAGQFRATFEDKVIASDIIILRAWTKVRESTFGTTSFELSTLIWDDGWSYTMSWNSFCWHDPHTTGGADRVLQPRHQPVGRTLDCHENHRTGGGASCRYQWRGSKDISFQNTSDTPSSLSSSLNWVLLPPKVSPFRSDVKRAFPPKPTRTPSTRRKLSVLQESRLLCITFSNWTNRVFFIW